jgi:hypothetical protein
MEDPWGSPWAEETSQPDVKLADQVTHQPVTREKTTAFEHVNSSPWDDNEGFGDWAAVPEDIVDGSTGLDIIKKRSPVNWDVETPKEDTDDEVGDGFNTSTSRWLTQNISNNESKLTILGVEEPIAREPSPDPWAPAIKPALSEIDTEIHAEIQPIEDRTGNIEGVASEDDHEDRHDVLEVIELSTQSDNFVTAVLDSPQSDNSPLSITRSARASSEDTVIAVKGKGRPEDESPTSRPSSSPSDSSHHGDNYPESPRTSFEEDPNRTPITKGTPSKVQELVELFESRTQRNGSKAVVSNKGDASGNLNSIETSAEDFGDFEDGDVEITNSSDSISVVEAPNIIATSTSGAKRTGEVRSKTEIQCPPPSFDVDISFINQIFEVEESTTDETAHPSTDAIDFESDDTFSSTEQRKTWYRVSRYGTMRKHNLGNDEDYSRVAWNTSQIHTDTLKFVARWMEEDRIGAGVILGGSNKLGSLFGWRENSTLPGTSGPTKAEARLSMQQPLPQASTQHRSSELIAPARLSLDMKPPKPVAPQFGWSSFEPGPAIDPGASGNVQPLFPPPSSAVSNVNAFPTQSTTVPSPNPFGFQSLPASITPTQSTKTAPCAKIAVINPPPLNTITTSTNTNSDDDDWGDMISSPVAVTTQPTQGRKLRHKPSRSVVDVISNVVPDNASSARPNHTASFSLRGSSSSPPKKNNMAAAIFDPAQQIASTPSTAPPASDPWESADFSFFDTLTPAVKPTSKLPPENPTPAPSIATQKSFTARIHQNSAVSESSSPSLTPPNADTQYQQTESEVERIVRNIVQGLPDLNYMLRR